jgi:outer membrane lipoprotein-sorting protein
MTALRGTACAAALLVLAVGASAADPAPGTLEGLMAGMARATGVLAEFEEVKTLALLEAPLESKGVLHFVPPDRMVRRTLEPARTWLVVDGRRVVFRDESGAPPVDLSGDPSARQFVDHFSAVFRGDLAALREKYEVRFEAKPPAWRLSLEPKDAVLRRFVASLTLSGEGESMRQMELVERDGDRTVTRFGRVETNHAYSAEELAALFGPSEAREPAP